LFFHYAEYTFHKEKKKMASKAVQRNKQKRAPPLKRRQGSIRQSSQTSECTGILNTGSIRLKRPSRKGLLQREECHVTKIQITSGTGGEKGERKTAHEEPPEKLGISTLNKKVNSGSHQHRHSEPNTLTHPTQNKQKEKNSKHIHNVQGGKRADYSRSRGRKTNKGNTQSKITQEGTSRRKTQSCSSLTQHPPPPNNPNTKNKKTPPKTEKGTRPSGFKDT